MFFLILLFFFRPFHPSVLWLPGITKIRGPFHVDGVRLSHPRPRAQAGRSRGAVQVRVRRPVGLAKRRVAGEQSGSPESRPEQAGAGHIHVRADLENRQKRIGRAPRRSRRSRRRGHVHQNRRHVGLLRDLSSPGRKYHRHHIADSVQVTYTYFSDCKMSIYFGTYLFYTDLVQ